MGPKIPDLSILGSNCHTWNQHPRICLIPKLREIMKCLNLGPKMPYLVFFWGGLEFSKNYSHIWNQHPQICLIGKFCKKKMSKFGTKNASFGYFWARILKNYHHIWNYHPRICLIAKFCKNKQKFLNLGPKMPYLSVFFFFWGGEGGKIWKNCCHIWNQHPQICPITKFKTKTKSKNA